MLRALIKYLHVGLNEREEGLIPLQQAVLLEDPIHPAQALRSGRTRGEGANFCCQFANTRICGVAEQYVKPHTFR